MSKSHATEEGEEFVRTLCGIDTSLDEIRVQSGCARKTKIDNADPSCGRCLRTIKARYKAGS